MLLTKGDRYQNTTLKVSESCQASESCQFRVKVVIRVKVVKVRGCGFRFWIQNEGRATEIPQTL